MLCPAGRPAWGAEAPRGRDARAREQAPTAGLWRASAALQRRWSAPHLPRPGARRRAPAHLARVVRDSPQGLCAWQGPRGLVGSRRWIVGEPQKDGPRAYPLSSLAPFPRPVASVIVPQVAPKPVHRVGDPTPVARATVYAGGPVEVPVPQPPVILPPLPPCQ